MQPILATLDLGGATVLVHAYATFIALAAFAAVLLGARAAHGMGVGWSAAVAGVAAAVVAGLVGARLLSVVLDWPAYVADPARVADLRLRGFALYGGLVAGSLAMLGVAVVGWRISPARLADRAVPAVVAGIVLVRVGCFLNGCCSGVATDLPWGVVFPTAADGSPGIGDAGAFGFLAFSEEPAAVHPTQLYEIAAVLGCGAVAWFLAGRGARPGVSALAFATGFLAFRAADQLLRIPPSEGSIPNGLVIAAYTVVTMVAAALLALRWRADGVAVPGSTASSGADDSEMPEPRAMTGADDAEMPMSGATAGGGAVPTGVSASS